MQKSSIAVCASVVFAGALLMGPFAIYHAAENTLDALGGVEHGDRDSLKSSISFRNGLCTESVQQFPLPSGEQKAADLSRDAKRETLARSPRAGDHGSGLVSAEHQAATEEIRQRINQEEILFGLKFTLVGAILGVLFSLSKKEGDFHFEDFIQRRRAAVFFAFALLVSAVIDTRLRFNARIIESLGDWVWCVETSASKHNVVYWEHFLHLRLGAGPYPLMRHFFYLLTALLYGATLYLFISMPRAVSRSSKTMITNCGAVFFGLLGVIGASYDYQGPSKGVLATLPAPTISALCATAGWIALWLAYTVRYRDLNIVRLTERALESEAFEFSDKEQLLRQVSQVKRLHFTREFIDSLVAEGQRKADAKSPGEAPGSEQESTRIREAQTAMLKQSGVSAEKSLKRILWHLDALRQYPAFTKPCRAALHVLLGHHATYDGELAEDALWDRYIASRRPNS